ncbi:uncharacterized protein EAE98_008259 [Botrytis deweyae]|uniref:Histidine kinase/HSP90-like ATPase domain-containing protein n=1 Tax=Botrytis deweyae TaxID=2478750 RepID=A0ABQ7IEV8_9HELO|nr:uncharacterized protein EAE98_008259 [Botrytis deweyae]KAF7922048.1 hypothetical protein EAE98_008259 [Botrytis deweyae]
MADQNGDDEGVIVIPDEQGDLWTGKTHNETLSIGIEYAKNWNLMDAFRELLLNWADAIKQSFSVSMEKLLYFHEISANGHKITVHHPESRKILGFLNFDKGKGYLELCNYQSQLSRKALKMGWTDKDLKDNLSGKYGEGLKIAALVMLRHASYQIRITASGYYWRLKWKTNDKTVVDCGISKVDAKDGDKDLPQNPDETQFRLPNPSQDVSVKIGTVYGTSGSPLTEIQAKQWLNTYLYFNCSGPKEIIQTKYGAVILKKDLRSRIYLKGVYLGKLSSPQLYKYGYDFYRGRLDRDRNWDASQLPDRLMKVWGEVVRCGGKNNVDRYLNMFQNTKQNWLDINGASTRMSESVAKTLWNQLQEKNPKGTKFYHGASCSDKKIHSVLKKEPVPLSDELWKALKKYTSVMTPSEYQRKKFVSSDTVKILDTPYCQSFLWTLRSILSLYNETNFEIVFKDGDDIDLDVCLDMKRDKTRLLLHKSYMSFEQIHRDKDMDCFLSQARSSNRAVKVQMFTCEHIINYLHARIIRELDKNDITTGLSTADKEKGGTDLIFEIRKCLKHMPRMIQLTRGHNNGELRVSWEDSEAGTFSRIHNINLESHVILHRDSTCRDKHSEHVTRRDTASNDETADIANCGCPQKIVSSTSSDNEITFAGLVSTESYFPKISRAKVPIAFFGFPPSPIKPTSNKPSMRMLATANKTENEDFSKTTVSTATSNTDPKENLPVQESRLDKGLNVTPQKSLRDRMSYDTTSIEAQLEKSESCRKILRQDVEKASSEIKELKYTSNTLEIEKESLSKQLTNTLLEKARLTQSLQQLKTQRMPNSANSQAKTDTLSVRIGDLNVKNADLEEILKKTRKAHAAQAIQLETFKKERDVMKSENATLQEKLSDSQIKNSVIKNSATVDLKEAHEKIDALEKRDVKMKIDIRQLKTDQEILEKRISQANSQIKRANMERDKATIEKNAAIAERDEAIMQKNKSLRKQRKFKSLMQSELERDESSDEGSRYVSGIKRDRSLDLSERDVVNDGVGNGNGSRSVKRVKRETLKIIELE